MRALGVESSGAVRSAGTSHHREKFGRGNAAAIVNHVNPNVTLRSVVGGVCALDLVRNVRCHHNIHG
jgi:hypothetical protein